MKKRSFISLSLISLPLVLFALFLSVASATPAGAQGMISAPSEEDDLAEVELGDLGKMSAQEIATVQRLLLRLGYLKDENMTRAMDRPTIAAVVAHLKEVNTSPQGLTAEKMLRSRRGPRRAGGPAPPAAKTWWLTGLKSSWLRKR